LLTGIDKSYGSSKRLAATCLYLGVVQELRDHRGCSYVNGTRVHAGVVEILVDKFALALWWREGRVRKPWLLLND